MCMCYHYINGQIELNLSSKNACLFYFRVGFPDILDLNQFVVHADSSCDSPSADVKSERQCLEVKSENYISMSFY